MPGIKKNKPLILIGLCLLTGTLDAIAALLIGHNVSPAVIFQYIASGWYGKEAFTGGAAMAGWGIIFHYTIAATFTIALFHLYPAFRRALKNKYLTGTVFGLLIWLHMNLIVLPFTNIPKRATHISAASLVEGILALIICVGLPIALTAHWYYYQPRGRRRA
jgi:uncharacterized membrane protein YagU involved in acid resistance